MIEDRLMYSQTIGFKFATLAPNLIFNYLLYLSIYISHNYETNSFKTLFKMHFPRVFKFMHYKTSRVSCEPPT